MADHETPSQRVVGSIPTRRTNSRRSQPWGASAGALSPDQTTALVTGNLERALPRLVVVAGDDAAGLEQKLQPPANGAATCRSEGTRDDRNELLPPAG
jgi:hypothetical protein